MRVPPAAFRISAIFSCRRRDKYICSPFAVCCTATSKIAWLRCTQYPDVSRVCCVQCALHTDILLIWPKLWKWVPNIGNDMPPEHTQRSHCTYGFAHSAHTHTHTQVTHSHKVIHTNECTLTDWIFCMFLPLLLLRCRCGRSMLLFFVAVAGHCWYFGRLLYSLLPHFFFPNFGCVLQPINRCYPFRRNAVCLRRLFVSILLFFTLSACNRLADHQIISGPQLTIISCS